MTEVINIQDKDHGRAPRTKATLFFYGDEGNPFLGPGGVHAVDGKLIVADTAQNRVFIWNKIPDTKYHKPEIVPGQLLSTNTERNAGGEASAASFLYPSDVWSNGTK